MALLCFSLALLYRLWNEVWSNSVVVASFYGETHSHNWWVAVAVSTMIPAFYTTMGGMRASLFSDSLQAFLGLVFLFVILGLIGDEFPDGINQVWEWEPEGGWLPGGVNIKTPPPTPQRPADLVTPSILPDESPHLPTSPTPPPPPPTPNPQPPTPPLTPGPPGRRILPACGAHPGLRLLPLPRPGAH